MQDQIVIANLRTIVNEDMRVVAHFFSLVILQRDQILFSVESLGYSLSIGRVVLAEFSDASAFLQH